MEMVSWWYYIDWRLKDRDLYHGGTKLTGDLRMGMVSWWY